MKWRCVEVGGSKIRGVMEISELGGAIPGVVQIPVDYVIYHFRPPPPGSNFSSTPRICDTFPAGSNWKMIVHLLFHTLFSFLNVPKTNSHTF
jgi:hypothetical protein